MQLTEIVAVRLILHGLAMECLKLFSLILDLLQILQGVDHILEHVHLLFRTKVGCLVNK